MISGGPDDPGRSDSSRTDSRRRSPPPRQVAPLTGFIDDADATPGARISDRKDVVGHHAVVREHTQRHVAGLGQRVRIDKAGAAREMALERREVFGQHALPDQTKDAHGTKLVGWTKRGDEGPVERRRAKEHRRAFRVQPVAQTRHALVGHAARKQRSARQQRAPERGSPGAGGQ